MTSTRKRPDGGAAEAQGIASVPPTEEEAVCGGPSTSGGLFAQCKSAPVTVPLDVRTALSEAQYKNAARNPRVCNLQLRARSASSEDGERYPASLAAADAYALSPVLQGRIESCTFSFASGPTVLEINADVDQKLLDTLAKAIYAKQLVVEPGMVEDLLRLADCLQMEWLANALSGYIERELLPVFPMAVARLAAVYTQLQLFLPAAKCVVERPIESRTFIDLLELAYEDQQRTAILKTLARRETPAWFLEHLLALQQHSTIRLTPEQAQAVAAIHPELFISLNSFSDIKFPADVERRWGQQVAFYRETMLASESAKHWRKTMVWDLPIPQLQRCTELDSPECLQADGGRRFKFSATSRPSKDDASKLEWGLYVDTVGSTTWKAGDRFKVTAVKAEASRILEIPIEAAGNKDSWGFPRLLSRWMTEPSLMIHRCTHLPVALTKL